MELVREQTFNYNLVLQRLIDGNKRFIEGEISYNQLKQLRKKTAFSQSPDVIIVTCSDSRVPPELIFSSNIGELFVVRTAGNFIDKVVLESIEFALENLKCKIIIVMGHTNCGAIKSAINEIDDKSNEMLIIGELKRLFKQVGKFYRDDNSLGFYAKKNVNYQISKLMDNTRIKFLVDNGLLKIIPALYYLDSGKVEFYNFLNE